MVLRSLPSPSVDLKARNAPHSRRAYAWRGTRSTSPAKRPATGWWRLWSVLHGATVDICAAAPRTRRCSWPARSCPWRDAQPERSFHRCASLSTSDRGWRTRWADHAPHRDRSKHLLDMDHGIVDRLRPRHRSAAGLIRQAEEVLLHLAQDHIGTDRLLKAASFRIARTIDNFTQQMLMPQNADVILRMRGGRRVHRSAIGSPTGRRPLQSDSAPSAVQPA